MNQKLYSVSICVFVIGYFSGCAVTKTPVGSVLAYSGPVAPSTYFEMMSGDYWMVCDGRALSSREYPDLYQVIERRYGSAEGAHGADFNLPDYRGLFLRGVDDPDGTGGEPPAGEDPDASFRLDPRTKDSQNPAGGIIGSYQDDAFQDHVHKAYVTTNPEIGEAPNSINPAIPSQDAEMDGWYTGKAVAPTPPHPASRVSPETRSKNIYVNWVIKVK